MSKQNNVVKIGIQEVPNENILSFHMTEQTYKHMLLGKKLQKIKGIEEEIDEIPLCFEDKGNYDFDLEKGEMFAWNELLPKIKRVINSYFKSIGKKVEYRQLKPLSVIYGTGSTKEETVRLVER